MLTFVVAPGARDRHLPGSATFGAYQAEFTLLLAEMAAVDSSIGLAGSDAAAGLAALLYPAHHKAGGDQQCHRGDHGQRDDDLAGGRRLDRPGICRTRNLC
jgi:hypothetical protein